MISGIWGRLELYCGNYHTEPSLMTLQQKKSDVVYCCACCKNEFSTQDVEKMLDKLSDIINTSDSENEMLDVTNLKFTVGKCKYQVLENDEKVKISGINIRALTK